MALKEKLVVAGLFIVFAFFVLAYLGIIDISSISFGGGVSIHTIETIEKKEESGFSLPFPILIILILIISVVIFLVSYYRISGFRSYVNRFGSWVVRSIRRRDERRIAEKVLEDAEVRKNLLERCCNFLEKGEDIVEKSVTIIERAKKLNEDAEKLFREIDRLAEDTKRKLWIIRKIPAIVVGKGTNLSKLAQELNSIISFCEEVCYTLRASEDDIERRKEEFTKIKEKFEKIRKNYEELLRRDNLLKLYKIYRHYLPVIIRRNSKEGHKLKEDVDKILEDVLTQEERIDNISNRIEKALSEVEQEFKECEEAKYAEKLESMANSITLLLKTKTIRSSEVIGELKDIRTKIARMRFEIYRKEYQAKRWENEIKPRIYEVFEEYAEVFSIVLARFAGAKQLSEYENKCKGIREKLSSGEIEAEFAVDWLLQIFNELKKEGVLKNA